VRFVVSFAVTIFFLFFIISIMEETTGVLKSVPAHGEVKPQQHMPRIKFDDVKGVDAAKDDLQELVQFLQDPQKFTRLGGKLPKGVLLTGPPGTGKTLLARAVAGEAGVPFFFMSGSEFDEMYVGLGARRMRDLFASARAKAPAIIFIDEIDAVGSRRNPRDQHYMKQTLNQLLVEMDGFKQTSGIIIIGATNFPQLLDKALTRPGRFDKTVVVSLPDVRGRIEILEHHARNVVIGKDVDFKRIARATTGFSGADLENLVNQAAVRGSREHATSVTNNHFEWARDKIVMGAANPRMVSTKEGKLRT
jgi:ATP-dependent metalloprotease